MSLPNDDAIHLASAVLRLHKLPQDNTTNQKHSDGDSSNVEEKLTRVTISWYIKTQKKSKGEFCFGCFVFLFWKIVRKLIFLEFKLRLCDSKVIRETTKWVEFDVRPAIKSWFKSKSKNMGLAILVEDQDSNVMKADKIIKGASCTVGTCECVD